MCIAISKPHNVAISKDCLKTCYENNPNGAGFMYTDLTGKLRIEKPFFTFGSFWQAYNRVQQNNLSIGDTVIHFRITTSGKNDKLNTHPHRISENVGFVHNGILDIEQPNKKESDTVTLNRHVLQLLGDGMLDNLGVQEMLHSITDGSKLIFLDSRKQKTLIIHENEGAYEKGVWFSNNGYLYSSRSAYSSACYAGAYEHYYDDDLHELRKKEVDGNKADESEAETDAQKELSKMLDKEYDDTVSMLDDSVVCNICGFSCATDTESAIEYCHGCLLDSIDQIEIEQRLVEL